MNGHGGVAEDDETKTAEPVTKIAEPVTKTVDSVTEPVVTESPGEPPAVDEPVVDDSPEVEFTIIHNKDKYKVSSKLSSTILMLKYQLADIIGVPVSMQKIMIKGLAKDDETLLALNVSASSKIMVVGAKLKDIVAVSTPSNDEVCHR